MIDFTYNNKKYLFYFAEAEKRCLYITRIKDNKPGIYKRVSYAQGARVKDFLIFIDKLTF